MSILRIEQEKYRDVWTFPKYREHSPGEEAVPRFLRVLSDNGEHHRPGESVIDFGCGEGRGAVALSAAGFSVCGWDFVDVRSKESIAAMSNFVCEPLWVPSRVGHVMVHGAWAGFCVDVLEHIPTEFTMLSIDNMLRHIGVLYLEISNNPDAMGGLIGQPLHLTVQPFAWWRDRIKEIATVLDARDLMGHSAFLVESR